MTLRVEGLAPSATENNFIVVSCQKTDAQGNPLGTPLSDRVKVEVVSIDLEIAGISEFDETTQPAFVPINDDYDEQNTHPISGEAVQDNGKQHDQPQPVPPRIVTNDNELIRAKLKLDGPADQPGKYWIEVLGEPQYAQYIRVWLPDGTPVPRDPADALSITLDANAVDLLMEGLAEYYSTNPSLCLKAHFIPDKDYASAGVFPDVVDESIVEVGKVDLDINLPEVIDVWETAIPDENEKAEGSVTFVNLDNDDADDYWDMSDDAVTDGDNELVKLRIQVPSNVPGTTRLVATEGAGTIRVWKTDTKAAGSEYALGAILDVSSWSIETHSGVPYRVGYLWVEGIEAHTAHRQTQLQLRFQQTTGQPIIDDVALTVLGVESVEWVQRPGSKSAVLSDDPNWLASAGRPDGKRLIIDEKWGNNVDVKVTLSVAPPRPIDVFLRWFDVDDPTADTAPVDDDSPTGLADDNRGSDAGFFGESWGLKLLHFDAYLSSAQSAIFQTSWNPGDNWRVVANGDFEFLNQLENDDVDLQQAAGSGDANAEKQRIVDPNITAQDPETGNRDWEVRQSDKYCSPTLSVWRVVFVDIQTMAAPDYWANHLWGKITDLVDGPWASCPKLGISDCKFGLDGDAYPLNDGSPNIDGTPLGYGRFENGKIIFGDGNTMKLIGNGNNYVQIATGPGAPMPQLVFRATIGADPDGNFTMGGHVTNVVKNGNEFIWSMNVDFRNNDWSDFIGGRLYVASGSMYVTITGVDVVAGKLITQAMAIPVILEDDDVPGVLPYTGRVPQEVRDAYADAYIEIIESYRSQQIPFKAWYESESAELAALLAACGPQYRSEHHWGGYVAWGYEPWDRRTDGDPNSEGGKLGYNHPSKGVGCVYRQTVADAIAHNPDAISNGWTLELVAWHTFAHELGHAFGLGHRTGGAKSLMSATGFGTIEEMFKFCDEDLALLRSCGEATGYFRKVGTSI
jgi:hypothetical protein